MFCYPENIQAQLTALLGWLREHHFLRGKNQKDFAAGAAHFLSELNAIHSFRDGNGRTQVAFMALLAAKAGHPFDFDRLDPRAFLDAMIASFQGDETPLAMHLEAMVSV